jgi:signal transduction histidine kinase
MFLPNFSDLKNMSLWGLPLAVYHLKFGFMVIGVTLLGWLNGQIRREDSKFGEEKAFKFLKRSSREQDLGREIQRMSIVFQMATALNATLNYERILRMALDIGTTALAESDTDESKIKSAIMLFEEDRIHVAAARGLSQADIRTSLRAQDGILAAAITNGETAFSHDPPRDPELRFMAAFHTTRSAVCIPLRIGLRAFGFLLFGHPGEGYFKQERVELLETVAQQVMIALQNARLYSKLEQEKQRIMDIHDETRKKLARDLHDGPTQSIAAIAMRINFARRLIERDPRATANELFKVEELARRTTKEIRQMLFTLRPLILESSGLVSAIEQLAEKVEEAHNQEVIIQADESAIEGLSIKKQGLIFSIIEEATNNARKHAQAQQIWIRLERQDEILTVVIEDNGTGFDLDQVVSNYEHGESLGLINLRERAELVNGILQIDTAPNTGTKIILTVPLTEKATEPLNRPGFASHDMPIEEAPLTR